MVGHGFISISMYNTYIKNEGLICEILKTFVIVG